MLPRLPPGALLRPHPHASPPAASPTTAPPWPAGAYLAPLGWRLGRLWTPHQMVAAQLPHLRWSDEQPPICSFYSFASLERPAEEAEEEPVPAPALAPPLSKPAPSGLEHSASAPPTFHIKASAAGKAD